MRKKNEGIVGYILREHKGKLALSIVISAVSVVFSIYLADMMRELADEVVPAKDLGVLARFIIIYCVFCLASTIVGFIGKYIMLLINLSLSNKVKPYILGRILNRSGDYFASNSGGELFQIVMSDVDKATVFVVNNVTSIISVILSLCGSLIYMFTQNWQLTVILLIVQPVAVLINQKLMKKISYYSEKCRSVSGDYVHSLHEIFNKPVNIITSGMKKECIDRANQKLGECLTYNKKMSVIGMFGGNLSSVFDTVIMCLVLGIGGYCIVKDYMTIGVLMIFITYSGRLQGSLESIWSLFLQYAELKPVYRRVNRYFVEPVKDRSGKVADHATPDIVFENVTFAYDDNKLIYDDMSLKFDFGKSYGIIGKTGEGKSTMIKLIYDLWEPQHGKVVLGGSDCCCIDPEEVSSVLSYVSADSLILRDTVFNNITLGNESATREDVIDALRKVNFYDEVMAMENGLDTLLGDNGATISSGQQQRLMLARAIISDKKIVILDEPTAALDSKTEKNVMQSIYECFADRLLIIISHNESILTGCDSVLRLTNGRFETCSGCLTAPR